MLVISLMKGYPLFLGNYNSVQIIQLFTEAHTFIYSNTLIHHTLVPKYSNNTVLRTYIDRHTSKTIHHCNHLHSSRNLAGTLLAHPIIFYPTLTINASVNKHAWNNAVLVFNCVYVRVCMCTCTYKITNFRLTFTHTLIKIFCFE